MTQELVIRGIKIFDIGYITCIYFVMGLVCAIALDKFFGKYDVDSAEKKPFWRILLEAIAYVWLLGVLAYFARNIAECIPFALEGFYGYQHNLVKELASGSIFMTILMFYSTNLQDRLRYLYSRATKAKKP